MSEQAISTAEPTNLADWYFTIENEKTINIEGLTLKIKKPTQTELATIRSQCTEQDIKKGKIKLNFNDAMFNIKLFKTYVISPNLNDSAFLQKNGASCIEDYLNAVLPGKILEDVADEIYNFGKTFKSNDELEAEITKVKN